MNQLPLDKSMWVVVSNQDGTYLVGSDDGEQRVIVPSTTLAIGMQIVDEHRIALEIYKLLARFPEQILDADGTAHRRPSLMAGLRAV